MGGVGGKGSRSGLGEGVGLVWFELNTKGETGRESLKMDMGEMGRFCGLPGLKR